jgi:predicted DNA-binding transcriptional regulator YafY
MIAPAKFDTTAQALDRLLLISELLQRSTSPVCAGQLAMSLGDKTDRPWSKRTVERDLRLLSDRGLVVSIGRAKRGATLRWKWSGAGMLRSAS